MKYPFLLFTLCATLCFVACTENNNTQQDATSEQDQAIKDTDMEVATPINVQNPSQINSAVARAMLEEFRIMTRDSSGNDFVCGFKLNHGDLQALLADRDTTNQDTIYAMIGYNKDSLEYDLIFCIETPINSGNFDYYDFTAPCPDYCPGYAANCAPPTISAIGGNKGYWFGREGISDFLKIGTDPGEEVFFMLPTLHKDSGILMIECAGNCARPKGITLGPCGKGNAPPCHEIQ